jgi:hypothetical protein
MEQVLCAVDLKLTHSDSLAQMKLMKYVTNGTFDPERSIFQVPVTVNKPEPTLTISRRRKTVVQEEVLVSLFYSCDGVRIKGRLGKASRLGKGSGKILRSQLLRGLGLRLEF